MSENDFLQWFCISCHPLSSPQTLHRAWKQNGNNCFFSFLMSGTVSVCSVSHLNLSSMLLTVVLVIIVQLPPSYQGKIFVTFFLWLRNRIHS